MSISPTALEGFDHQRGSASTEPNCTTSRAGHQELHGDRDGPARLRPRDARRRHQRRRLAGHRRADRARHPRDAALRTRARVHRGLRDPFHLNATPDAFTEHRHRRARPLLRPPGRLHRPRRPLPLGADRGSRDPRPGRPEAQHARARNRRRIRRVHPGRTPAGRDRRDGRHGEPTSGTTSRWRHPTGSPRPSSRSTTTWTAADSRPPRPLAAPQSPTGHGRASVTGEQQTVLEACYPQQCHVVVDSDEAVGERVGCLHRDVVPDVPFTVTAVTSVATLLELWLGELGGCAAEFERGRVKLSARARAPISAPSVSAERGEGAGEAVPGGGAGQAREGVGVGERVWSRVGGQERVVRDELAGTESSISGMPGARSARRCARRRRW